MALHIDLVKQARKLAMQERGRPLQASLRRSVSTSYYALYHLLVNDAVRRMIPGKERDALRACLARAFGHAEMRKVAQQFANRNISPKLVPGLNGETVQRKLERFSVMFMDLQQARHEADYDIARKFTRREALEFVDRAGRAVADWRKVRQSVQAHTFLVGLLSFGNMRV